MHTLSSARRTCIALASAVECTATVLIPISPRLAMRSFSNIPSTRPLALSARQRGEREGTRRVSDGEGEVGLAGGATPPPHPDPLRPRRRRGRFPALAVLFRATPQCFPSHPRSKSGLRDTRVLRFHWIGFDHLRHAARVGHHLIRSQASPQDRQSRPRIPLLDVVAETDARDRV